MEGLFFPVLSVSLTTSLVLLPLLLAAGRLNRRYAAGTLSALWLVLALRSCFRRRGKGCGGCDGCCSHCSQSCGHPPRG